MTCEIYGILQHLAQTPGRNDKLEFMGSHKASEQLQTVLFSALDPYTQYYIRKIPNYTATGQEGIGYFIENLYKFSEREVTGHAAINKLTQLLTELTPEAAIVAERIIKKDLRCGVQASSINKVWKDLIPTYPCLLAKPYDEKTILKILWPAYSQLKADGMRVNVICRKGKGVTVRGRSGKFLDLHGVLDDDFSDLSQHSPIDVVFDGELIVLEIDGTVMSRKKGNGILNKAVKGTMSEEEASRVRVRLWDMIAYEKFLELYDGTPYQDRLSALSTMISACPGSSLGILKGTLKYELIVSKIVHTLDEAMEHFQEAIAAGEEGTMLKNMNSPWENKRSANLVKLKAEEDCDLIVTGYNPGSVGTKNDGKMGSLICESSDGKVVVSISGFSDELRDEITDNFHEWEGRIVTVLYNERIADKSRKDIDSLFLPRFVELREDKTEADHSSKIK